MDDEQHLGVAAVDKRTLKQMSQLYFVWRAERKVQAVRYKKTMSEGRYRNGYGKHANKRTDRVPFTLPWNRDREPESPW